MSYARIRQLKDQSLSIDQGSLGGRTKMSDPPRTDIATIDTKDKQAAGLDYGGSTFEEQKADQWSEKSDPAVSAGCLAVY